MPGPRSPRQIELAPDTRAALIHLTRSPSVEAGLAGRARIVVLAADGLLLRHIGPRVGVVRNVVRDWLDRFRAWGLAGRQDRPLPGRRPDFPPEVALHTVRLACALPDVVGRSLGQWDCAELARQLMFIREWNEIAHPFNWTAKSFDKVLAKAEAGLPAANDGLPAAA